MDTAHGVPFTDEWTSLEIRRNRKSYFFACIMLGIILAVGWGVINYVFHNSAFKNLFGIMMFFGCMGLGVNLSAQRMRDMNTPGWFALGAIFLFIIGVTCRQVPLLALFLLLCCYKGTKGTNRYGIDPLMSRRAIW